MRMREIEYWSLLITHATQPSTHTLRLKISHVSVKYKCWLPTEFQLSAGASAGICIVVFLLIIIIVVRVIFHLIKRRDGETYDVDAVEMAQVKAKVNADAEPDMACFGADANAYSEVDVAQVGTKADADTD